MMDPPRELYKKEIHHEIRKVKLELKRKEKKIQKYNKIIEARKHVQETVLRENANRLLKDIDNVDCSHGSSCGSTGSKTVKFQEGSPDVVFLSPSADSECRDSKKYEHSKQSYGTELINDAFTDGTLDCSVIDMTYKDNHQDPVNSVTDVSEGNGDFLSQDIFLPENTDGTEVSQDRLESACSLEMSTDVIEGDIEDLRYSSVNNILEDEHVEKFCDDADVSAPFNNSLDPFVNDDTKGDLNLNTLESDTKNALDVNEETHDKLGHGTSSSSVDGELYEKIGNDFGAVIASTLSQGEIGSTRVLAVIIQELGVSLWKASLCKSENDAGSFTWKETSSQQHFVADKYQIKSSLVVSMPCEDGCFFLAAVSFTDSTRLKFVFVQFQKELIVVEREIDKSNKTDNLLACALSSWSFVLYSQAGSDCRTLDEYEVDAAFSKKDSKWSLHLDWKTCNFIECDTVHSICAVSPSVCDRLLLWMETNQAVLFDLEAGLVLQRMSTLSCRILLQALFIHEMIIIIGYKEGLCVVCLNPLTGSCCTLTSKCDEKIQGGNVIGSALCNDQLMVLFSDGKYYVQPLFT